MDSEQSPSPGKTASLAPSSRQSVTGTHRRGQRQSYLAHIGRLLVRALLLLLLVIGGFLSLTSWGRSVIRAGLLLPALLSVSEGPGLDLLGSPVRFTRTTLHTASGPVYLDSYTPLDSPAAFPGRRQGVIVIAGLGDNRADRQLINFARSLASDGVAVMITGTPALFDFVLARQDSNAIVAAVEALSHWPSADPGRIGLVGFSAGNALACFAAADPRIRAQVAFVLSFGGFFNATSLLQAIATHRLQVDGQSQSWTPYYVPLQALAHTLSICAVSPLAFRQGDIRRSHKQ